MSVTDTDVLQEGRRLLDGWQWTRLKDVVVDAQAGFACGDRDDAGLIQLRMNNVTPQGNFDWGNLTRVPINYCSDLKYLLSEGDVLFNNTNSAELVGKSTVFNGYTEPVAYSNHFTRLRTSYAILNPTFLARWLNYQWYTGLFRKLCTRWVGQAAFQRDRLLNLLIPLPPLPEQRRIAAILNDHLTQVERVTVAAETQLEAARALPAAYLAQAFCIDQSKTWPMRRLEELGVIVSGVTLGRKLSDEATRKVPYLRVANVKDGRLDLDDVYDIEATEREIEKLRLQYGDLLLTEGGDPDKLGRGTFWQDEISECIHQNHIFRVRLNQEVISPQFASFQLSSTYGKCYFLSHAKRTTGIATINRKVLEAFPMMVPPLAVQNSIVEQLYQRIEQCDLLITAAIEQLRTISNLPGSILASAFGGKL